MGIPPCLLVYSFQTNPPTDILPEGRRLLSAEVAKDFPRARLARR